MKVPFFTSTREYRARKTEIDDAVAAVMDRGDFILGKEVAEFEKESAEFLGAKFAVGVASGSDALVLAADILGFKNGAEVLTPTFTFFSSTSCIVRLGGKPVFVDLDDETLNMDISDAQRRLTAGTVGILPVHLFVQPTDMAETVRLARAHNLKVLEDAAEAWGMESRIDDAWKKAGTIGDIGIYSFFPTKTLGAYGDAGLMVTDDEDLYRKIKSYRVHGSSVKYLHDYVGYNSRLDTLQAAVLRVKLRGSTDAMSRRARHAAHYTKRLSSLPEVRLTPIRDDCRPVHYVFNIRVPRRDELVEFLKDKGIGTSIYYPRPLHLQKCFSSLGYREGDFPVAEKVCKEIFALPMFPELQDDEVDYVCDQIASFFRR